MRDIFKKNLVVAAFCRYLPAATALVFVIAAMPAAMAADDSTAATACVCPTTVAANDGSVTTGTDAGVTSPTMAVTTETAAAADSSAAATDAGSVATAAAPADHPDVRFSELLPDPVGKDTDGEFIELYNHAGQEVSLAGWSVVAGEKKFVVPDINLAAGSHYYFSYAETKLTLVNTGAALQLLDASGTAVDSVVYGAAKVGQAYARDESGVWSWTTTPTPGGANVFTSPAQADTGTGSSSSTASAVAVTTATAVAPAVPTDNPQLPVAQPGELKVSEFLPNPAGSDEGEWTELANVSDHAVSLAGWSVDDSEGGSTPFPLPSTTTVAAGGFLVLTKPETGLALNNDGDAVRLIDPTGTAVDVIVYQLAPEGQSCEKTDIDWRWTDQPTPGAANHIVAAVNQAAAASSGAAATMTTASAPAADGTSAVAADGASTAAAAAGADGTPVGQVPLVAIADLAGLADGTPVVIIGVVNMPPGRLAKTLVGIQDSDGAAGVIVRFYGSTVPVMAVGETWRLEGKVQRAGTETRLSTSAAKASKIAAATEPLAAAVRQAVEIDDGDAGVLVAVSGVVTGRGANWLTFGDDAVRQELRAELPSGVPIGGVQAGDRVTVTGVVRLVKKGLTLVMAGREALTVEAQTGGDAGAVPSPIVSPSSAADAKFALNSSGVRAALAVSVIAASVLGAIYVISRRRRAGLAAEIVVEQPESAGCQEAGG